MFFAPTWLLCAAVHDVDAFFCWETALTDAPVLQWSTDAVREPERAAYWVDAICAAFLDMHASPRQRSNFYGSVSRTQLNQIGVMRVQSVAQDVRRDERDINRSDTHAMYLIAQLDGPWGVRQAGRYVELEAGDCVLVDSAQPYDFHCPGAVNNVSIELPKEWCSRWVDRPETLSAKRIDGSSGWGRSLAGFVEGLGQWSEKLDVRFDVLASSPSECLGSLLSLALPAPPLDAQNNAAELRWRQCEKIMRERFAEHGLVAEEIAKSLDISVATLHRWFALRETSFATYLRSLRIQQAQMLMSSSRMRNLTLAEIGRRSGFVDASHFSKQFAAATGVSPRHWRSQTQK